MAIVTRFAPSPTGRLHLGHALAALTAWQAAREAGGRFLLRLEDIDPGRCRPEFAAAILADLAWLGLGWDSEVRVQSQHFSEYRAVLENLERRGLLYPCFCSRSDIARAAAAPHAPDGSAVYPGTCRDIGKARRDARIAAGAPHAWRLDMARACTEIGKTLTFHDARHGTIICHPDAFGDVVMARKDMPASYHLCVTHDDAIQGVTLVTRGEDLLSATDVHRLLQALLDYPTPDYAHHRLLTDASGRRLAKRDASPTLASFREANIPPEEIIKKIKEGQGSALDPLKAEP